MKRNWRRFKKWLGWTLASYRSQAASVFKGLRRGFRDLRRSLRNAIPFLRKKSTPIATPRSVPSRTRRLRDSIRWFRNVCVFTARYYWLQTGKLFGGIRRAGRRIWKRFTRPHTAAQTVTVAVPQRPKEKLLKRIIRAMRRLPGDVARWARGSVALVAWMARSSWKAFRRWLRHGTGYTFLRGVPALAVSGLVLWALLYPYFQRAPRLARYADRLDWAVRNGDTDEAILCAERLINDSRGNAFYRFAYASLLAEKGDKVRALATMNELAPLNASESLNGSESPGASGYGPAHLWLAQLLLSQKNPSPAQLKEIEARLKVATKGEPSTKAAAQALLIRFYCGTGNPERAEGQIGVTGTETAGAQLNLAVAFAVKGDRERAVKHATAARDYFSAFCAKHPDLAEARLEWAQAVTLLGDFNGAIAILDEGYRKTNGQGYRTNLARMFYALAQFLGPNPELFTQRVSLFARAVEFDDSNPMYIRSLIDLLPLKRSDADVRRAGLDKAIAQNNSPMVLQIFLGIDSFLNKDTSEAARRYALARALNPECPRLLNNMAWTMANTPPERLSISLNLINEAISQAPDQIRFLDTRGQILAKLERWEEAMRDLKKAATVLPDNKDLQEAMARVSSHLNEKNRNDPKGQESTKQ
jgi:tetratricopeptide (TPR) repeat protein